MTRPRSPLRALAHRLARMLARLCEEEPGATAGEYALVAALIVCSAVVAIFALVNNL